jgi:hypothetical protein
MLNYVETYSKKQYIHKMVSKIREIGDDEFWVLNKQYMEIYKFRAVRVSEFDVQMNLDNELAKEHIFSGIFVLHMKEFLLRFLEEVPGTVYVNKLECYRELYDVLYAKAHKTKSLKQKKMLVEKIEFIENEFPQFVI